MTSLGYGGLWGAPYESVGDLVTHTLVVEVQLEIWQGPSLPPSGAENYGCVGCLEQDLQALQGYRVYGFGAGLGEELPVVLTVQDLIDIQEYDFSTSHCVLVYRVFTQKQMMFARMVELADTLVLEASALVVWGFESLSEHP